MGKETPIILGIIFTIVAIFIIVSGAPIQILDLEGDVTVTGDLNVTGSGEFGDDVDMNLNYILYMPMESWIHVDLASGVTDVEISSIPSGTHGQDRHYAKLHVSVETAPGADKFVNVTLTDGTNSLTVSITGADKSETSTTTAFDLDVSAETLTLKYSQTAGGSSNGMCVMSHWYYKENE